MSTYSTWATTLAPVVDNGVSATSQRLWDRVHEAQRRLYDHALFVARREDYSAGLTEVTFPASASGSTAITIDLLTATKLAVLAAWREENNQIEMALGLMTHAFTLVDENIVRKAEASRRAVSGDEGRLHNELPDGVKIPTARLTAFLTQATTEAQAHQSFVQRREDYKGTAPAVTFEIKKKLVESYLATAQGQAEFASAAKKEALELIERDIIAAVETSRRDLTTDEGRLHNELPDGVKIPTTRLTAFLTQATTEAQAHQSFVQRREDYKGTAPTATFEIKKKLVESYLATAQGQAEFASAAKKEAFELIERDIIAAVEKSRRDYAHPRINRLHNELPNGVKIPSDRMAVLSRQAAMDAASHQNFIQRRENYTPEPSVYSFAVSDFNVTSSPQYVEFVNKGATAVNMANWKAVAHAYNENVTPPCTLDPTKPTSTFVFPSGVTLQPNGKVRLYSGTGASAFNNLSANPPQLHWGMGMVWDSAQDIGYLHTPDDIPGVDIPEAVVSIGACSMSWSEATASVSSEIEKKLVESYLATEKSDVEYAALCKKEAFELIERDIISRVEEARKNVSGDVGRLHNEIPDGVKIKTSRMAEYLTQANDILTSHWVLTTRNEDLALPVPTVFRWEAVKLCVQSLVYQSRGELEAAAATKTQALEVITTEVREQFVSEQKLNMQTLFSLSAKDTLGNYVSRFALDTAETGLSMPTSKLTRLINTAEETLFTKGRWHGTTKDVSITIAGDGEVELPPEVDVPLAATFDNMPITIHSRELEYVESGPGGQSETSPTVASMCLIDRGERVVSGETRRICFAHTFGRTGTLRLLYKSRFATKSAMATPMQIKCYPAIKEMVLSAQTENPQEALVKEASALRIVDQQLGQHRGPAKTPVNGPYGVSGFSHML